MNMNTCNEICLLADQDLDAVVGGRIATGRDPKPLPGGDVKGVPGHPLFNALAESTAGGALVDLLVFAIFA
jgi:hypothetical protein